jgi:hypothetical protein
MPLLAKIMIAGFIVAMILLGAGLCKVSGYWSRVEEEEEIKEYMQDKKDE